MKIDKNKIKTNLFFLYKSHKLYLVFLAYCFYRMYEKNREFTFYNIVSSLVMSISLYIITYGLIDMSRNYNKLSNKR